MTGSEVQLALLDDARLAAHALSPAPVWLWSTDANRILWANPTAAAIFNGASPAALETFRFEPNHPAAVQIARLAGTMPQGGAPRLERLRGFGANVGGALVCLCSRIVRADGSAAVLVVSTERAGPILPLQERARRLIGDFGRPAAAFTADGELIFGTPAALKLLGNARDLTALGAAGLAKEASFNGRAEGSIGAGRITLIRAGAGNTVALILAFAADAGKPAAAPAGIPFMSFDAGVPAKPEEAPARQETAAPQTPGARRAPLRFVWQMDAETRFTLATDDFAKLAGPGTAALLGRPWREIADALKLDPGGAIAHALASQNTWSGIVVSWPVDARSERLAIEMSGLPVFDRERKFTGYRGFGICRAAGDPAREAAPTPQPSVSRPEQAGANILPFRVATPEITPTLSPGEQNAFHELARELTDRLKKASGKTVTPDERVAQEFLDDFGPEHSMPVAARPISETPKSQLHAPQPDAPATARAAEPAHAAGDDGRPILDRLPIGILVYRLSDLLYANRAFLDWTGYSALEALRTAGGLDSLFIESKPDTSAKNGGANGGKTLTIATQSGTQKPVEGRLFSVSWGGENAMVLMLNTAPLIAEDREKATDARLRGVEVEIRELKAVLDTATDGVLLLDRTGRVLSANRSAQALFGYDTTDFPNLSFGDLFAPESRRSVLDALDRLVRDNAAFPDAGRDVIGRERQGGLIPLYMTMGRIEDGEKVCAVLRDVTAWKRTEEELINARQQAEKSSTAKSEFLAKISHEIRTPLNAIIGFSEVMIDERFGPVGNERYRQYLRDIHASGGHLISLLNDLLDLSKIEAGKLELTFVSVNLNDIVQQCVAIMQQQANRERVIIRSSLPANLPQIVADVRSVRQIVLNLLSNSIKFTGAGGQVIVSTALNDLSEVIVRVRDTGAGMSEKELETALEPFRQLATSARWGSSGTGLGLPITKALTEANHARFRITSEVDHGTLVEVSFPATRVLAQ